MAKKRTAVRNPWSGNRSDRLAVAQSSTSPSRPPAAPESAPSVFTFKEPAALDLLQRLGDGQTHAPLLATTSQAGEVLCLPDPTVPSVEDRLNAVIGCKTTEVALAVLAQVVQLEHPNAATASDAEVDTLMKRATAMLAELQPTTATETMLAAQMVGTHRTAMKFLERATLPGQTFEGVDANVLRATRLMRLFNEQVETMAKLKGKGGQQRVIVEHVTVAAGGQAIVGTVIPGGRGSSGANRG